MHLSFTSSLTLTLKRINLGNFHHFSEKYYSLQDNFELFLSWKSIFSFFIYTQTWILCQWRHWKCSYKAKLYFSTWKFCYKHGWVVFCPGEWNHPVLNTSWINSISLPQQAPYLCHSVLLLLDVTQPLTAIELHWFSNTKTRCTPNWKENFKLAHVHVLNLT